MAQRYPTDAVPSNPGPRWATALPDIVERLAADWELELGAPFVPGGQCAYVVRVRNRAGQPLVLKVAWRHPEAEHEADGLRHWDGAGAVRCLATRTLEDSSVLLLERCVPGTSLTSARPEAQRDAVIARVLRRLWARALPERHPFEPLAAMCDQWADSLERRFHADPNGLDPAYDACNTC